jgi:hypothetical protein
VLTFRKTELFQIKNLMIHYKAIRKQKQMKSQKRRKKGRKEGRKEGRREGGREGRRKVEIIQTGVEVNEMKSWFFEKINIIKGQE